MKEKWLMIMLFIIVLSLSINFASAADPTDQSAYPDLSKNTTATSHNTSNNSWTSTKIKTVKAAGETSTTTQAAAISVTNTQLTNAAISVKSFVDKNKRMPNYVTIAGTQITISQYLMLLSEGILNLNNGMDVTQIIKDVSDPTNPSGTVKSGNIAKSEYINLAENITNFIRDNGRVPNYVSSSLGNIRYESIVYLFSKIMVFHNVYNRLPSDMTISSWSSQSGEGTISSISLQKYLIATRNCQSTNTTIKNLAASITAGKTTTYSKALAIYNWVRDHLTYSFYYNTKKGALGALSSRSANCCDHTHLVIALARAAGIPGRYIYVTGHVYAQLYAGGKWYNADAIHNNFYFGMSKTSKILAVYASLPF